MREDIEPSEWELGKQAFDNKMKYGTTSWYEWRLEHWNTKWNAYFFDEPESRNPNEIRFCTAWSAPHPILQKLSEMYPEITIDHSWADEDIGYNCGAKAYKNGELIEEYYPTEGEKDAISFAAEVMDYKLAVISENDSEEENEIEV